jgi:hypothetical protein
VPVHLAGAALDTLAHPLREHAGPVFSPLAASVLAVVVVASVAYSWPQGRPGEPPDPRKTFSWAGPLHGPQVATRAVAVAVLLLAIVAGRFGSIAELENVAPALVIGAAWPLLLLGSALIGPVWRWLDPWDALVRPVERSESPMSGHVWWALLPAALWVWYLSVLPQPLAPRSVSLALAIYTVVTVAGCLAAGRAAWLSRAEVFGLLFGWVGMLPRRLLPRWRAPGGAEVVLGVLAGGLVFGAVRLSELWGGLNVVPKATLYATIGVVTACAAYGSLLWMLGRWAGRLGAAGSVAVAAVPAVAALAVALALARNRLFTSVQLLPGLLLDPLRGGDGSAAVGLNPDPLGHTGLAVAQLAVLIAGHLAGAIVMARRTPPQARGPGMVALTVLVAGGVVAITGT